MKDCDWIPNNFLLKKITNIWIMQENTQIKESWIVKVE